MEKREKTCVEIFTLCRDAMDFRSMYFDVFWRYQCSKRSQNQEMLFPSAKGKPIYIYSMFRKSRGFYQLVFFEIRNTG